MNRKEYLENKYFDDLLINGTTDKYLLNVSMAMSKYLLSGLYFCRLDTSAKSVSHKKYIP
jgi:hypothetical protein